MAKGRIPSELLEELHTLITGSFDAASLERLMRFRMNSKVSDFTSPNVSFGTLVFELLKWAEENGVTIQLLEALILARPEKIEFSDLLAKLQVHAGHPVSESPAASVPLPVQGASLPRLKGPPDALREVITRFERLQKIMTAGDDRIARQNELVAAMRLLPLEEYDLTDYLHLSVSSGERLAAIVSLHKLPNPRYLHWLSERLAVEEAFIGYHAGLALYEAAQTIPLVDLDDVVAGIEKALAWLPAAAKGTGRHDTLTKAMKHIADRTTGRASQGGFNL